MIRSLKISFIVALSLTLSFCKNNESEKAHPANTIIGHWAAINPMVEAHLVIREDSTFHVDILATSGIEAEGIAAISPNNRITFTNTAGTDSVASNPIPGVYDYTFAGDTLKFTVVQDTVARRMGLLSAPWLRE